jgi:hypothetical protein
MNRKRKKHGIKANSFFPMKSAASCYMKENKISIPLFQTCASTSFSLFLDNSSDFSLEFPFVQTGAQHLPRLRPRLS